MRRFLILMTALGAASCAPAWQGEFLVRVQAHISSVSERLGPPTSTDTLDGRKIYRWVRGNPPVDGCVVVYRVDDNDRITDVAWDGVPAICAALAEDLQA